MFARILLPSIATRPSFPRPDARAVRTVCRNTSAKSSQVEHPEAVDRPKVRIQSTGQIAEAQVPAQSLRNLPAAVDALDGPEQPELQQKPRRIGVLAHAGVAALEGLEIEALDQVVDEKHRVARIQRLAQMRRKQLPLVLLIALELDLTPHDRHAYQMTCLGSGS